MRAGEVIYEGAVELAVPVLRLAAPLSDRLRRGVAGRAVSLASLRAWAAAHRDVSRPLLWLHAPSVGEALMAQAILAATRARVPDAQFVFTHFSPSAERVAPRVGADWSGYLPWDRRRDVRAALDAVRPACVAFVRTEIWPVLLRETRRRGARALLLNAVLAASSSRTRFGARTLLGPAYASLDAVGAVSEADAERLPLLGVAPDRIRVTGDARFDQVWSRVQRLDPEQPLLRAIRARHGRWLVAGSTWDPDEARVVAALTDLKRTDAAWRAVVAPHEPSDAYLVALEARLDAAGLSHARLPRPDVQRTPAPPTSPQTVNEVELPDVDVLVVDRVGVLADLYAVADAAYVGGGFGSAGLHSVVEPAALAVAVIFGPRHGNAHEAGDLARAGGGTIVQDAPALRAVLERFAHDDVARRNAGDAALAFVRSRLGGAEHSADMIVDALVNVRTRTR